MDWIYYESLFQSYRSLKEPYSPSHIHPYSFSAAVCCTFYHTLTLGSNHWLSVKWTTPFTSRSVNPKQTDWSQTQQKQHNTQYPSPVAFIGNLAVLWLWQLSCCLHLFSQNRWSNKIKINKITYNPSNSVSHTKGQEEPRIQARPHHLLLNLWIGLLLFFLLVDFPKEITRCAAVLLKPVCSQWK